MADNVNSLNRLKNDNMDVEGNSIQQIDSQENIPWWSDNSQSAGRTSESIIENDSAGVKLQDGNQPWWAMQK